MAVSKSQLTNSPTHKTLLGILLISSLSLASSSAYDLLERYNFPKGILPEGVQSYLLRPDGGFDVFLAGDCEFKVQGYQLRYKQRISGTVETGRITDLSGVSVKILFAWIGISELTSSGGQLKFYVGPLSASFSITNFEDCPRCRCGFDCADEAMVLDS